MKRPFSRLAAIASLGVPLILVTLLWLNAIGQTGELVRKIDTISLISFFETPLLYYYLHLFTFVPVFLLSFDRRVSYYKSWGALIKSIAIVGLVFILWDIFFTHINIWDFNEDYFWGHSFFQLPLEECLFFLTIPFATVFIYECLNHYYPKDFLARYDRQISIPLALIFLGIGLFNINRLYTATTFLLSGGFLLFHYLTIPNYYRSLFYRAYLLSLIPFFLVNGVLTGGYTNTPVVMYNPEEFMGIRLGAVPLEDAAYSFLLLFGVISLFEYFRREAKQKKEILD